MTLTPRALILLNVQRQSLEGHPRERELTRQWAHEVDEARSQGDLIVMIQWDGEPDTQHPTFSRGWTLHPDFRAEAHDLLLRARHPDAYQNSGLDAELKGRAVQYVRFLALDGDPAAARMTEHARTLGFKVQSEKQESALA